MTELALWLLTAQAVVGAVDTLLNHELLERLPYRPEARTEIGLHSVRELIYASLFGGLAWFEWHGWTAAFIGGLLAAEVVVTSCDEAVENRIRVLPQNERVLHVLLTLNLGVLIALLAALLAGWWREPAGLVAVSHGFFSWALSAFAAAAVIWSIRDVLAWLRLRMA
jgi:hypothetical protein